MISQTFSVIFANLAHTKKVFSEKLFGNWILVSFDLQAYPFVLHDVRE